MDETSASGRMYRVGQQMGFYMQAGMWTAGEHERVMTANNNYRKMHGLPMYHRNKPARRTADRCWVNQYEVEHEEEMEWLH